jgi:Clr5 domain
MAPPKIDFEIHKDRLYNLYVVERRLMDDVRQYMKTIYNFDARYVILLLLFIYITNLYIAKQHILVSLKYRALI